MKKKDLAEMLTATEVAKLWNERAAALGLETNYTRWSVYGQKDKLDVLETPLGPLFKREQALTMPLPRYRKRPDTTQRNKALKGKTRDKETGHFVDQATEDEPQGI